MLAHGHGRFAATQQPGDVATVPVLDDGQEQHGSVLGPDPCEHVVAPGARSLYLFDRPGAQRSMARR